jgi:hypothetical protein
LLSAIFWIERSIRLNRLEKIVATVFIGLITGFGICFLVKLQKHLKAVVLRSIPTMLGLGGAASMFCPFS